MLNTVDEPAFTGGQQLGSNLWITVHIWIDETIKAEELDVPDEFEVTLGPELQRLFQKSR